MKKLIHLRGGVFLAALVAFFVSSGVSSASAAIIYNSIDDLLPGSYVSLGYEATSTTELGDYIQFAGTERVLTKATVTLTNWACENDFTWDGTTWIPNRSSTDPCVTTPGSFFNHPITLNIYAVDHSGSDPAVGTLLATKTLPAEIFYRPSYDPQSSCTPPASDVPFGGTWYSSADDMCYHGYNQNIEFDFSADNIVLPNEVILGVSYDTADYGKDPIHVAGPYNSLNYGLQVNVPSVGTDVEEDVLFWDTTYPGYTAGFKRDTGWTPYTPAAKIEAITPDNDGVADSIDKCPGTVADNFPMWGDKKATNRWMLDSNFVWVTKGKVGTQGGFAPTIAETYGCSGTQILAAMKAATGLDFEGHDKFGLSKSMIEDWMRGTYHVGPTFVETVVVPADDADGVSSTTPLDAGKNYFLKASGTAYACNVPGGCVIVFDADYSTSNAGTSWEDGVAPPYDSYGPDLLDLMVNGGAVNWGVYSGTHTYQIPYAGTGSALSLFVNDLAGSHVNNSGNLSVDIIEDKWVNLW